MRNAVADIRTYATSLTKGLRLLALFTRERPEWGVSEMSVAIGAAKSTVSRIARTLEAQGFLVRSPEREKFRLGLKLWEIGVQAIGDKADLPRLARRYLEDVVARGGESAQAVLLDNLEAVYVEKVEAPRSIRTWCMIGQRFPLHCTATGNAMLAYQSEAVVTTVLKKELGKSSSRAPKSPRALSQALAAVRSRGFALNKGGWREDIGGIAAPIFDRNGDVFASLGVTMPIGRFPREVFSPLAKIVVDAALALSRELGYWHDGGVSTAPAPASYPAPRTQGANKISNKIPSRL